MAAAGCGSSYEIIPVSWTRLHVTVSSDPLGLPVYGPARFAESSEVELLQLGVTPITLPVIPGNGTNRAMAIAVEWQGMRHYFHVLPNRGYHVDLTGLLPVITVLGGQAPGAPPRVTSKAVTPVKKSVTVQEGAIAEEPPERLPNRK